MKLTGYGYSCWDGHGFRYFTAGKKYCDVRIVSPNPYSWQVYIWGNGASWFSTFDAINDERAKFERLIEDNQGHQYIGKITALDTNSFVLQYQNLSIVVRCENERTEFYHDGVQIGFDDEAKTVRGETISLPAARDLRFAEFQDALDTDVIMLLLATKYLIY